MMQTLSFPKEYVAKLSEFDDVLTEGMPLGCALVQKGYKYGLFSLEKGELVLPVEYAHPRLQKNGLFQISTLSGVHPQMSGLFSFERREFVLPMQEWRLELSLDHAYVYATLERSHPRICGVFGLQKGEWVLPLEKGYVFGKPADCYSEKKYSHNEEEFVVIRDTRSPDCALGLFSPTRGFIFEPEYEQLYVHTTPDMLIANAVKGQLKECFVVRGGDSWKTPQAADVLQIDPPFFVLKMEGKHFGGQYGLFDARDQIFHITGSDAIFPHKNLYIGVNKLPASTTIYVADTGETRHIDKVAFETSIDDDYWIVSVGNSFGAYSLQQKAVIIPPVFESLAHIDGDCFFARWQGRSLIIDLARGEIQLPLKLGAPPKPPMLMDGWMEVMPGLFADSRKISEGLPLVPSPQ